MTDLNMNGNDMNAGIPGQFRKRTVVIEIESTDFAELLKSIRTTKNISQDQIAKACGVKRSTVAMWETAGTVPRLDQVPALCVLFDLTPNQMFGWENI